MAKAIRTEAPRQAPQALVIGGRRLEPAAWLGLGILAFVALVMSLVLWGFSGQGPWPVPIVWAVASVLALRLLATRELRLTPAGIGVTRHLLRWSWTRWYPPGGLVAVRVDCAYVPPRHSHGDGTPEGEAPLLMFTVALRGRPRLTLDFGRDVEAMEALARRAAALLGLPLERQGYERREADRLPVRRRGVRAMAA